MTNLAVFFGGAVRFTSTIPLGGKNITNDIAIGLRTTIDQAEQLKITYGSALASRVDPEEMLTVAGTRRT